MRRNLIIIVIPVYNEEANLEKLIMRLNSVTCSMRDLDWEYIFVNDGSSDKSLFILKQAAKRQQNIKILDLSRNFGKEIALTAGVHAARSDAVICIDADLQHPPEVIPKLVDNWRKGAEVVSTIRTSTDKQRLLRRLSSYLYYWVMARISGLDMISQTTDFRLFDKKVVDAFCKVTERDRMFRGIIDWMGFRRVNVEFEASAREHGAAGYTYAKLWSLAISSITSFSLFPLKIAGYLGVIILATSSLLLSWMLISKYALGHNDFTPLAIVAVSNTLLIGVVLLAIGLVALYIGSIHTEVINRPLYLVRERINFQEQKE